MPWYEWSLFFTAQDFPPTHIVHMASGRRLRRWCSPRSRRYGRITARAPYCGRSWPRWRPASCSARSWGRRSRAHCRAASSPAVFGFRLVCSDADADRQRAATRAPIAGQAATLRCRRRDRGDLQPARRRRRLRLDPISRPPQREDPERGRDLRRARPADRRCRHDRFHPRRLAATRPAALVRRLRVPAGDGGDRRREHARSPRRRVARAPLAGRQAAARVRRPAVRARRLYARKALRG